MNILLINCDLGPLEGHCVQHISLRRGGVVSLRRYLKTCLNGEEFCPDILLQRESLGVRLFFKDLPSFACIKAFWAIDSHLNLYWHHWYAKLFDIVLTPHPHLFNELPPLWKTPHTVSFSVPGYKRPFVPHLERKHMASFVGLITKHRPQRARFAAFLKEHHAIEATTIPFARMLDLYDQTRLLPNESICREFNFRITEGASCGACVLTEDIGDDLAQNFSPNTEVLTYRHALELDELLSFLQKKPALSEKIGKAAWYRIRKEHLPEHRWRTLLEEAAHVTSHTIASDDADRFLLFAVIEATRGDGTDQETLLSVLHELSRLPRRNDVLAMHLTILVETGRNEEALELLRGIIAQKRFGEENLDLCTTCLLAAKTLAPTLVSACIHSFPQTLKGDDLFSILMHLASLYAAENRLCRPGFYSGEKTVPGSAFEILTLAETVADTTERARTLHSYRAGLADSVPYYYLNIKSKAEYSLDHQDDWRASFDYAWTALREFRVKEGLSELLASEILACQSHEEKLFAEALRKGDLLKALTRAKQLQTPGS
ncbi:MAG: glycosyltransferase [Desulfovibrio sp.]|nr:glycosyltransferase [Desulfovibrio sp.]